MKFRAILKLVVLSGAILGQARALPITLFNTGVDGSGNVLPDGTVGDAHYSLVTVPVGGVSTTRVKTSASGYPIGPWIGDSSVSAWIGPNSDSQLNGPAGIYVYRTTFDLTGLDASTASIAGRWAEDDGGQILLNGSATGNFGGGFSSFTLFSISSGFIAGINVLDFEVYNGGGPTGLRVEMTGSATALSTAVPDASSTMFLLAGVVPLLVAFRRRKV